MAKASALDKAIANLKYEIDVLELAVSRLEAQRLGKAPARRPRIVKTEQAG